MDEYIEDLFEKAEPFSDSELTFRPDFERCNAIADTLEDMLMECFGEEAARLFAEYTLAHFETERFPCLHFFHQGYLAAKAEQKKS